MQQKARYFYSGLPMALKTLSTIEQVETGVSGGKRGRISFDKRLQRNKRCQTDSFMLAQNCATACPTVQP